MNRIKTVHVNNFSSTYDDWPPERAEEFLEWFKKKLSVIPEEFMEHANIRLSVWNDPDGDHGMGIAINYKRIMTDEEQAITNEKMATIQKKQEIQEREQLNFLLKKYGTPTSNTKEG